VSRVDSKTPLGRNIMDGEQEHEVSARTVFQAVLESSLPSEEKSVDRLVDEAFVLVVAGTGDDFTSLVIQILTVLRDDRQELGLCCFQPARRARVEVEIAKRAR
jgi:predicted glycosyltransferase